MRSKYSGWAGLKRVGRAICWITATLLATVGPSPVEAGSVAHLRHAPQRFAYCVRLCDGLAVPLSGARGGRAALEATCAATCPGADTQVFLGPSSRQQLAAARSARDGRRYSALPTAFFFTRAIAPDCACGLPRRDSADLLGILSDMTLRRGDAIMTAKGITVFAGQPAARHAAAEFEPLARSLAIEPRLRIPLQRIEVASLAVGHDTFVALGAPVRRAEVQVSAFQALN